MSGDATLPTAHSPLGASGAHRWLGCPGSYWLSEGLVDPETEYAKEGTAAHILAAESLDKKEDTWRSLGKEINNVLVDKEMSDSVASYVVEASIFRGGQDKSHVEWSFHCPSIHPLFYGTADFVSIKDRCLEVWDFKYGAGVVLDVEYNPQLLYYAAGVLESLGCWNTIDKVVLRVIQPRGYHQDGPHRVWATTPSEIEDWLTEVCVPGMYRAQNSNETIPGVHCQFCPATRIQCPSLMEVLNEWEDLLLTMNDLRPEEYTDEQIGRLVVLGQIAKYVTGKAKDTAFDRLNSGKTIPEVKLVAKRSNREFKPEAEKAALEIFGAEAIYTKPEFVGPTKIDALPGGKDFTTEFAFKPDNGKTVAPIYDRRKATTPGHSHLFAPQPKGE